MSNQKLYNIKKPAHPDEAHTKSKRYFKTKGRRMVRRYLKAQVRKELGNF